MTEWIAAQRQDSLRHQFLALRAAYTPRVNLVLKWIGNGHKVLDIGCSDGSISERMRMEGNHVIAFDFHGVIETASRYPLLETKAGEAHDLPFADGEFDVVTAMELIEHYEEPEGLLKEWVRVVKLGGRVIVTTPDGQEAAMKHPTHKVWFNRRKLGKLFSDCGLTVSRASRVKEQATLVVEGVKRDKSIELKAQDTTKKLDPN